MCVGEEFTMVNKKTVTKTTNSKTSVSKTVDESTGKIILTEFFSLFLYQ